MDFLGHSSIKEDRLGVQKLHLTKISNSILANNFLKDSRLHIGNKSIDFNCSRANNAEFFSKLLEANAEDVVFKSLKDAQIKYHCFSTS